MSDQDRITLYKAMGWKIVTGYVVPYGIAPDEATEREFPDPFTSADDDYAVLRWMIERDNKQNGPEWRAFKAYFTDVRADWNIWNYEIGLFARAALKVIQSTGDIER